jgi:hypothetical protein
MIIVVPFFNSWGLYNTSSPYPYDGSTWAVFVEKAAAQKEANRLNHLRRRYGR